MAKTTIGNTTLEILSSAKPGKKSTDSGGDDYSDGEYEDQLLKLFKGPNPQKEVSGILSDNPPWPMRYHLSGLRENLLNWFPFKKTDRVLEVGAGCGAVTGAITPTAGEVTALELSIKRAEIVANRHRDSSNLSVVAGNLSEFSTKVPYDYVTLIGVLEYAGQFIQSDRPAEDLINMCSNVLKQNGSIIIAIENKIGLKYWAGAREDHTWRFFDSIEGYPHNDPFRTFSRTELINILSTCGFSDVTFYYPYPDFKLPVEIFSDHYPPSINHPVSIQLMPSATYDAPREHLFNEQLAQRTVSSAGLSADFANSFLIFASKK